MGHLTLLFVALTFAFVSSSINDETLVEKAIGQDVVFATVSKIQKSFVFPDDFDLLKRIAYFETEFGNSADTFPPNFYGGIWQLSESHFDATKSSSLASQHAGILKKFKIDWSTTVWTDLLKPLHSGLAARLYLATLSPIPQTLGQQAAHWKQYYSNEAGETGQEFIDKVSAWEAGSLCKGKMDLLVVLDESGSIGADSFQLAKEFVAKLFASYSLENVRQGFMTFSTKNRFHFPMQNSLTAAEIQSKVLNLTYEAGSTNTNTGLRGAYDEFINLTPVRPGVPKIMTLFTDGQSTDGEGLSNVALLKAANITSFAVGIANYLEPELLQIAYGDQAHVFKITDFQALTEFFKRLNSETCDIPQRPGLNETVEEEVVKNEKRIYEFDIPPYGLNVYLTVEGGSVVSYYSYTVESPSSALNDGEIKSGLTYIHPSFSQKVFVSVEGLDDKNKFALMGFARIDDAPDFGGGPCKVEGMSGHLNDCSLYHNCFMNEVGDLWDIIKQCPGGEVWCKEREVCESPDTCPCDIV